MYFNAKFDGRFILNVTNIQKRRRDLFSLFVFNIRTRYFSTSFPYFYFVFFNIFFFFILLLLYVYIYILYIRQQWNVGYMLDTFRETRPGNKGYLYILLYIYIHIYVHVIYTVKLEKQVESQRGRFVCQSSVLTRGPNSWIIQVSCILHEHLNGPVNLKLTFGPIVLPLS